ncbi:anaphase-promoting complex subunit 10 [Dimargaris cristalligena]|uniref:Anaphase-promoting complex subunit 10 n=1 Tax=Dimargaris cristalligena TaxID=215637 RepID=A0A4Q0A095_9FUNG|nr:anaphase-promoting complex subunit 10 [Dimargaris cristalligena]|eukprot:RKP39445.1 anaphase-promoting complex subunit 10 [Dimargaris cristalligena]
MELAGYHEVGHRARWSVSSARVDLGAEHLYDNDLTTFWQSDGVQPHSITLQFPQRTAVKIVALYMDYQQDESYTPNSISVVGGNSITDLQKIITHDFKEPDGWVQVHLAGLHQPPVDLFTLRVLVHSNHQFGKDCHIRQIKVFAPQTTLKFDPLVYTSLEFNMASRIR